MAKLGVNSGPAPASRVISNSNGGQQVPGVFLKFKGSDGKTVRQIRVSDALPEPKQALVLGHEAGHAIADIAKFGKVAPGKEMVQSKAVYHQLATGKPGSGVTPQSYDYAPKEWPHELIAENLRAYLTQPGWFKTVAPDAAAALRSAVNGNKTLSKHIQLNGVALGAVGAASTAAPKPAAAAYGGGTYTRTYTTGPKAGTTEIVRKPT
jgi:hypothetical protein